ncbi:MAG: hypothetical protein LBQ64_04585 [Bacteroidales bacterium]|jgi:hypothetical protein|nr:hypothetical protein [Bacteroidales bacterium]
MKLFRYLVIAAGILLTLFSCGEKNNMTDEDFIWFAQNIEKQIVDRNETPIRNAFDYDEFEKIVTKQMEIPRKRKKEASEFIREHVNPALTLLETTMNGADFHFVKFYRKDNQPHIVFRTYIHNGVSLEDWVLGVKDNQICIYDAFNIVSGISWSDECRQKLCNYLELFTDVVVNTNELININYLISTDSYAQADSLLYWVMPQMRENMYARTMEMNLASLSRPYNDVRKLAEAFTKTFPDEPRTPTFYLMQSGIRHGLVNETVEHIQTLISLTGDDPIYYLYQAWLFEHTNEHQYALQSLDSAINYMPHIFDLYLNKLDIYYEYFQYEECMALLYRIDTLFMPPGEDASFFRTSYPQLTEHKPFNEWVKQKETSMSK